MKIIPYEKVEKPLVEYISFLLNVKEGFVSDKDTPETIDRKRTALHDKVCEAFGLERDSFCRNYTKIYLEYTSCTDANKLARYYWMYITDEISSHSNYGVIETSLVEKHEIKDNIERLKCSFNGMKSYCEEIFDAFKKDREDYNKRMDEEYGNDVYRKNLHCFVNFWHDYSRATYAIERCIRTMEDFSTYPVEAYTKAAVDEYIEKSRKHIVSNLNIMAAQAAWCQMYHRKFVNNETKFKFN